MKETNNQTTITGKVVSEFIFSHEVMGERFYIFNISAQRTSGTEDEIPVLISDRIIDVTQDYCGEYIIVTGQFRSFNYWENKKRKLELFVFAQDVAFVEDEIDGSKVNQVYLEGYVVKPPIYRNTPLGREIADLLIAVNRSYGRSDYIPCICWGRNARYASTFEVGDHVLLHGRIQSREYMKRISENESEKRIAYEVSVSAVKRSGKNGKAEKEDTSGKGE